MKKKIIGFSLLSMTAVALVTTIVSSNSIGRELPLSLFGSNPVTWYHYDGVDPDLDNKGIREYWVSCESHEHQFTAPTGDVTIEEGGAPSRGFIDSLANNDDRLLPKYARVIDFENGANDYITVHDGTVSLSVVDDEGVNGSKALRAVFSSAGHLDLAREMLDAFFANPNVAAISFYAKSTTATNNFRHITVDQSVVHDNGNAYSTYESNISNYGVNEGYKQFYLTRGVYGEMNASDWFIQYGATGTLYLDNITTSYHDYFDAKTYGLEYGWSRNVDANTYYLYNPVGSNVAQLLITGSSSFENAGVDYSAFTEGVRSVKLTKKSGQVNYYLRSDFQQSSLPTEGIYVDFKTDTTWNEAWHETNGSVGAGSMGTGKNNLAVLYPFLVGAPGSRTGVQNIVSNGVGQWQTLHIKKSEITDDSRFLIISGGATGNVFIDNIRLATEPIDSFENAYAYVGGQTNNVIAGASSYPVDAEIGSVPSVFNVADYIFTTEWGNTASSTEPNAEITDERASNGDYSLKLEMRTSAPLRLRPSYLQMLLREGGTLSFDVYSDDLPEGKYKLTTLAGNVKNITKGEWTTVTLTAADFLKDGQTSYSNAGRFTENAFGAGTIYIDNIRYAAAE